MQKWRKDRTKSEKRRRRVNVLRRGLKRFGYLKKLPSFCLKCKYLAATNCRGELSDWPSQSEGDDYPLYTSWRVINHSLLLVSFEMINYISVLATSCCLVPQVKTNQSHQFRQPSKSNRQWSNQTTNEHRYRPSKYVIEIRAKIPEERRLCVSVSVWLVESLK